MRINVITMPENFISILKNHPVNVARVKAGKRPANSLWFWGEGTKPSLQNFEQKFGLKGGIISAVDLLKGIGILADLKVIEVEGATGNYDTNFKGKAKACVDALLDGLDYVYVHMEAPDECGHHGDAKNKIYSIEQIDGVVKYVKEELEKAGEPFKMLICPDHPTPLACMTHVSDPIPFVIYDSQKQKGNGANAYTEEQASKTGLQYNSGEQLVKEFLDK